MKPELSIVIPAFEEEIRLGDALERVFVFLSENAPKTEVIVVDDGSGDTTADVARSIAARFSRVDTNVTRDAKNRGEEYTVKIGV